MTEKSNIELRLIEPNKGQIEGLPKNPRQIKGEKFKKLVQSIKEDPEMMELREILVYPHNGKYVIIGGNMRYEALKELNLADAPCKVIDPNTPVEKLRAYTIKDNSGFGEWDWEMLANEWDEEELDKWAVDLPEKFDQEDIDIDAMFQDANNSRNEKYSKIAVEIPIAYEDKIESIKASIRLTLEDFEGCKVI